MGSCQLHPWVLSSIHKMLQCGWELPISAQLFMWVPESPFPTEVTTISERFTESLGTCIDLTKFWYMYVFVWVYVHVHTACIQRLEAHHMHMCIRHVYSYQRFILGQPVSKISVLTARRDGENSRDYAGNGLIDPGPPVDDCIHRCSSHKSLRENSAMLA